jgi:hypothetical protein
VVLLRWKYESAIDKRFPTTISQWERDTSAYSTRALKATARGKTTYIGVLSVHACSANDPGLFLVLVDHERVCIDATLDDLKACLVGNSIAISKGRGTQIRVAGHDMETRQDEDGFKGDWLLLVELLVVVGGSGGVVGNLPKKSSARDKTIEI